MSRANSQFPAAEHGLVCACASLATGDDLNEDCFGVVTPAQSRDALSRGSLFAVADGASAGGGGRVASELTVRTLLQDFYATAIDWGAERSFDTVLRSVNDWLYVQNARDPGLDGVVSTLSTILIRGGRYHIAHVGDTRVYRWRNGHLDQLTKDHVWPRRDMRHVLRRAIGLDMHLVIDFHTGDVRAGDVFLLASDGVWEVLGLVTIEEIVAAGNVQDIAGSLVKRSIESQRRYMGRNDATAVVIRAGEQQ